MKRLIWIMALCLGVQGFVMADSKTGKGGTYGLTTISSFGSSRQDGKAGEGRPFSGGGRGTGGGVMGDLHGEQRTVLYRSLVKRYGRWEGQGKPLTKSFASHLPCYYRLTYVGGSKYPARMEALDGYHRLTTSHGIGTYLLDQNSEHDSEADSLWMEKLKTVCKWDFVYNEKDEIAIERAYDKDGKLVYSYIPVKIGNKVAGTFTDAWGMPAKMRSSGATVVYITYDENGFETLQEFMDAQGYRQKNNEGAYMSRRIFDKKGHVKFAESLNILGEPMLDNYGNCGGEAEYDENGQQLSDINIDNHRQPMRIKNGNDPFVFNVIKRKYDYDEYGRMKRVSFVDLENRPDTNQYGIHCYDFTYNEHGQRTSLTFRDLNGSLKVNPQSGVAWWKNEFDEEGRLIADVNEGDRKIFEENESRVRSYYKYGKDGNLVSQRRYCWQADTLFLVYEEIFYAREKTGLRQLTEHDSRPLDYVEKRFFYDDDMIITVEHDQQGKQSLWMYADLQGRLTSPPKYGYSKSYDIYEYKGDTIVYTGYYTDEHEKKVIRPGYSHLIYRDVRYLNKGKLVYEDCLRLDKDSVLVDAWRNYYDESEEKIGESPLNSFGQVSKTGKRGVVYYKINLAYNMKGETSSYASVNEWGEPAYFEANDNVAYYWNFIGETPVYYDEFGRSIPDMKAFRVSLPAVMSVVIIDSAGYRNGLRDNDIILKYGNWTSDMLMQNSLEQNSMYMEFIAQATSRKQMLVLRHHPEEKRSEVVEIDLPKGSLNELGFFPQLVYYTQKERQRHEAALAAYLADRGLEKLEGYSTTPGKHQAYMRIPCRISGYVPTLGENKPWVVNPAFVLSMAPFELENDSIVAHKYWNIDMNTDTLTVLYSEGVFNDCYITVTDNLENTYEVEKYSDNQHVWRWVNCISDEQYDKLMQTFANFSKEWGSTFDSTYLARNVYAQRMKVKDRPTPSQLFSQLRKEPGVSYDTHALGVINADSLKLPESFAGLTRIFMSKMNSPAAYERCSAVYDVLKTEGYVRLPYFGKNTVCLVRMKDDVFTELFMVQVNNSYAMLFQHQGTLSRDDVLAFQRAYGDRQKSVLGEGIDIEKVAVARAEYDGVFTRLGYKGTYVILQLNNWHYGDNIDSLGTELAATRELEHHLKLVELIEEDDEYRLGEVVEEHLPVGMMGLRMVDYWLPKSMDRGARAIVKRRKQ